jgi:hypothetical protein
VELEIRTEYRVVSVPDSCHGHPNCQTFTRTKDNLRDYAVSSSMSVSVVKRKSVMKSTFKELDVGLVE